MRFIANRTRFNSRLSTEGRALGCRVTTWTHPQPVNLVDLGFMDARSKLIDLAAFLDRVQHAGQEDDFRVAALKEAVTKLHHGEPDRARQVLLVFSDPTTEPVPRAAMQGAIGAWKGGES